MKQNERIYCTALLMILLATTYVSFAHGDVTPYYPPWYAFEGYVRDNLDRAIPGATVQTSSFSATTGPDGYYYIGFNDPYSGPINASKTGYFTEKTSAGTTHGPTQVDFNLTIDAVTWITTAAIFPNTSLAYIEHTQTTSHTVTVKSYAAGSGNTVAISQTFSHDLRGYSPKVYKRKANATGIYTASGNLTDLFIRRETVDIVRSEFRGDEYLRPDQVVGNIEGVLYPSAGFNQKLRGSLTLQAGLVTNVGFTIPGFSMSIQLETTMAVSTDWEDSVDYTLYNNTTDYRYWFKIYFENMIIPHIWFLSAEYIGDPGGGGGCPYAWTWNGTSYVLNNNILATSERTNGTDVNDYYRLEQSLIPKDGKYSLQISEFEHEDSYIDQVRLLAIDHDSNVKIAVDPNGQILTYKTPYVPISAIDNHGNSRLNEIRQMDGDVNNPATFFQGNQSDYLILNFGQVASNNAKLILRDDQKCTFENCIDVQVLDSVGQWQTVTTLTPRNYWAVEGVDLSPYVIRNQDFKVKLLWTALHRLDYVGLDTSRQVNYQLNYATLVSAVHSYQGDVTNRLLANDNTYVELVPGQNIQLDFTLPNNQKEARTFILFTEGHYFIIP